MELTYIGRYQFKITQDGTYALPAYGDGFWQKYLDVFSSIRIIGEPVKSYLNDGNMVKLTDDRIKVQIIPSIEHPKELKDYLKVKKLLNGIITSSKAVLIKPASNKGIIALNECERSKIPYMIEMTGDIQLALKSSRNYIMKLYSNVIYKRINKAIKKCKFGLYVTEEYLQKKYPIAGSICGCTDALIPVADNTVLESRLCKIDLYNEKTYYKVGLIGYYHNNGKGIDTAIKAVSIVNLKYGISVELKILGIGSLEDQDYWKKYASKHGIGEYLTFDPPLPGAAAVAKWIDNIDIIILPSRSEGFPRAIAEAMSRGCPSITSNVCGLSEMVQSKWQHNPGNANRLALLLIKMITNKSNLKEAAEYNFNKSAKYNCDYLKRKRNAFLSEFKNYAEKLGV